MNVLLLSIHSVCTTNQIKIQSKYGPNRVRIYIWQTAIAPLRSMSLSKRKCLLKPWWLTMAFKVHVADTVQICKTYVFYCVLFKGILLYVALYKQWLDLWWIKMYLRVESKFTQLFKWISASFIFVICYISIWFYDLYLTKYTFQTCVILSSYIPAISCT